LLKYGGERGEKMRNNYAEDFYEIFEALKLRDELLQDIRQLIKHKEIVGKSLEGGDRKQEFRNILLSLVEGKISLEESYSLVETDLSESASIYSGNKRVFPVGWGERLVRTSVSKFYNQAILLQILQSGKALCYIPHSKYENDDSPCTAFAGNQIDAMMLLNRIVDAYENGIFSDEIKIPNHPHCTHVVVPIE